MDEYLQAAVPESTVLLGLELKQISIGHMLLLERFECLPVRDEESLVMAVLICSQDQDKVLETFADPWIRMKVRIWRWRLGKIDWIEKILLWEEYFEAGTKAPLVVSTDDKSGSKDSHTPFLQHLRTVLISKCNYTIREAMSTSLSQCLWDYYSWAETEGSVNIVDRKKSKETLDWLEENYQIPKVLLFE